MYVCVWLYHTSSLPSFCSELSVPCLSHGSGRAGLLTPFLPSLLSSLTNIAADSVDVVLLVVVDSLQLTAKVGKEGGGGRRVGGGGRRRKE